jgi:hypothetical protein
MQKVVKAVAGAAASGVLATATYITVPADIQMPWWGYILVGVANAALGFGVVYFAPPNRS